MHLFWSDIESVKQKCCYHRKGDEKVLHANVMHSLALVLASLSLSSLQFIIISLVWHHRVNISTLARPPLSYGEGAAAPDH